MSPCVCFINNGRCLPSVVVAGKMMRVSLRVLYRRLPGCSFTRSCRWNFQILITLIFRICPVPLRTASNDDRFSCILAGDLIDLGAVRRQISCIYIYIHLLYTPHGTPPGHPPHAVFASEQCTRYCLLSAHADSDALAPEYMSFTG